jgi:hypothetical protein
MRARVLTACCLLVLAVPAAGCRKSAPLAPKSEIDSVLSELGIYCGQATEQEAFGHSAGLGRLDRAATTSARHLIRIMRADPEATYLGQSMRRVVSGAASETSECRMSRAASALAASLGKTH